MNIQLSIINALQSVPQAQRLAMVQTILDSTVEQARLLQLTHKHGNDGTQLFHLFYEDRLNREEVGYDLPSAALRLNSDQVQAKVASLLIDELEVSIEKTSEFNDQGGYFDSLTFSLSTDLAEDTSLPVYSDETSHDFELEEMLPFSRCMKTKHPKPQIEACLAKLEAGEDLTPAEVIICEETSNEVRHLASRAYLAADARNDADKFGVGVDTYTICPA